MVTCKVCERNMEVITWKHLSSHSLTVNEYKVQFPAAEMRSEEATTRKRASALKANAHRVGVPRPPDVKERISTTKRTAHHTAWNEGRQKTAEEKQHLSDTVKRQYANGERHHWNTNQSTPEAVRVKIGKALRGQIHSPASKERRRATLQLKVEAGWVKRRTYEMTPEHYTAWRLGGQIANAAKCAEAVEKAADVCAANNITMCQSGPGSYLYQLKCNACGEIFSRTRNAFVDSKIDQQAFKCPVCVPRHKHRSAAEVELHEFVVGALPTSVAVISNDRTVLNGREIDCYIPELNVGIEYNGLYWHSERRSGHAPTDHNWKTKLAYTKGVRLITIFEDEWINKREIVESRIRHILKSSSQRVIYARKTTVEHISAQEKHEFLTSNHIQGTDNSSIRYGARHNGELVAVMTITKTNMVKGGSGVEYEINRFAVKTNTHAPGIASKLFQTFVKEHSPALVISYADRRWCTGQVYDQLGFVFSAVTPPSYWYLVNNYTKRLHRSNFMKHMLSNKLSVFDPTKTEWENMCANGFDRIWDCGTTKFTYTPPL